MKCSADDKGRREEKKEGRKRGGKGREGKERIAQTTKVKEGTLKSLSSVTRLW